MKFIATHRTTNGKYIPAKDETVVIILITWTNPELSPMALYVRDDGTMGEDYISSFTITAGAW